MFATAAVVVAGMLIAALGGALLGIAMMLAAMTCMKDSMKEFFAEEEGDEAEQN